MLLFIAFLIAAMTNQWGIAVLLAMYYMCEVHKCDCCCCEEDEDEEEEDEAPSTKG